jgi:hypothetical protein
LSLPAVIHSGLTTRVTPAAFLVFDFGFAATGFGVGTRAAAAAPALFPIAANGDGRFGATEDLGTRAGGFFSFFLASTRDMAFRLAIVVAIPEMKAAC